MPCPSRPCVSVRAYAPGEVKVISSSDGGNFEEAACWRATSRSEVSYTETVMFDSVRAVKALTVVMKAPMSWGYFGLNGVSLLSSGDESFMVVSGAASSLGERCLTVAGAGLASEGCLDAIAAGDGRDVFKFHGDQIVHTASNMCIALKGGSPGKVGLQDCAVATKTQDGRSSWELAADGQLKMPRMGNYCLVLSESGVTVADCAESSEAGDSADKFVLAAVPELDLSAAASAKASAALLEAAVQRQRSALSNLQALVPTLSSCKFAALAVNTTFSTKAAALYQIASRSSSAKLFRMDDPVMSAVASIDTAIGADIDGSVKLISDSSSTLQAVEAKIAQSA